MSFGELSEPGRYGRDEMQALAADGVSHCHRPSMKRMTREFQSVEVGFVLDQTVDVSVGELSVQI